MKLDENVYSQITSHRNFGLAYLEEERYSDAANEFLMLIEKAPKEPLGYANLGLTYMRMDGELKQSEKWILSKDIIQNNNTLYLSKKGKFISDTIFSDLLIIE